MIDAECFWKWNIWIDDSPGVQIHDLLEPKWNYTSLPLCHKRHTILCLSSKEKKKKEKHTQYVSMPSPWCWFVLLISISSWLTQALRSSHEAKLPSQPAGQSLGCRRYIFFGHRCLINQWSPSGMGLRGLWQWQFICEHYLSKEKV